MQPPFLPSTPGKRFARRMAVLRQGGLFGRRPSWLPGDAVYRPRTGDIVLRLLAAPGSLGLASISLSGYSHCGVVDTTDGHPVVDDCYPATGDHAGGLRQTAWSQWISKDNETAVLHWLALRRPGLSPDRASAVLTRLNTRRLGFTLLPDRINLPEPAPAPLTNCSAFVRDFLEANGVDCGPGLGITPVTWRVVRRFLTLVRQGFYRCLPGGAGQDYYALAKEYGLTAVTHCPMDILQPCFCELLPDLVPVAYGQNPAVPRATRQLALHIYRTQIPGLQAAMACHGLAPAMARRWLFLALHPRLRRIVAAAPENRPLSGTRLAITLLQELAATPLPYLAIPLAAQGAFYRASPHRDWLWKALLVVAPPLADLAGQLGIKPFSRLSTREIKV